MLNSNRQLSGLCSRDPQNLLSKEARIRIDDAYLLQQSIRDAALARIDARCGHDSDKWNGAARAEWSAAKMQAAEAVLSVIASEMMAIGKEGRELEEILGDELEGAASSLELTGLERRAVWSRLWLVRQPAAEVATAHVAGISFGTKFKAAKSLANQSMKTIASGSGISERHLYDIQADRCKSSPKFRRPFQITSPI